jgi:hypothetical protein
MNRGGAILTVNHPQIGQIFQSEHLSGMAELSTV